MSRLVITGSTGFVGRHLIESALEHNHHIQAWVRSPEKLDDLTSSNLEVVRWDAEAGVENESALASADAVIHLAAYLPPSYSDPAEAPRCFRINALSTLELLEACADAGVGKFVYTSSGNIYRPGEEIVDERAPAYPSRQAPYYLASKLSGEIFVDHFRRAERIDSTVILRPSAIYGPGMEGGVVSLFAQRLLAGEPIRVDDGGRHQVDLVYVGDVVDAILASVSRDVSGPFNIGSGDRCSIKRLATLLADICDAPDELVEIEPPSESGTDDSGGFSGLDVAKARKQLGYEPVSVKEGLHRFVDHLRDAAM